MFISHKSNVIQHITEVEWECRRRAKGLTTSEYWPWLATITSGDPPVIDYSGETGYTIVECIDENVQERLIQLDSYIGIRPKVYNIKWSDSKVSAVIGQDKAGEDITIQTHFSGDDTAKDARLLEDKWINVRRYRNADLVTSDWTILDDSPLDNASKIKWQEYRQKLRDVPKDNSDVDDINWPTKP